MPQRQPSAVPSRRPALKAPEPPVEHRWGGATPSRARSKTNGAQTVDQAMSFLTKVNKPC
jgi:hypothetical protein